MTVIAGNWTTGDKHNLKTQAVVRAGTFALSGVIGGFIQYHDIITIMITANYHAVTKSCQYDFEPFRHQESLCSLANHTASRASPEQQTPDVN